MKAASKTILFARVLVDKRVQLWPVGVFGNDVRARAYFTALKAAHATGDVVLVTKLDPHAKVDSDGKLIEGVKFSLAVVDYEPDLPAAPADELETSSSYVL
jgi:hypothetical protein